MPPVAPEDAAVGRREAAVDAGGVAAGAERAGNFNPHVDLAVAVGVFQAPDIRRTGHIQSVVGPLCAHRQRHAVGEQAPLVESPVAIRVVEPQHHVGRVFQQLVVAQVLAGALGHEQMAAVVKARHHGMPDQRRPRHQFDHKPIGHAKLGRREPCGFDLVGQDHGGRQQGQREQRRKKACKHEAFPGRRLVGGQTGGDNLHDKTSAIGAQSLRRGRSTWPSRAAAPKLSLTVKPRKAG